MDILLSLTNARRMLFSFFMIACIFYNPTDSGAVKLTQQNIDMTLASNELVFINFYADWCRFSNLLMPIFDEAAEAVAKEFPESGKVVMGKVDCDQESSVATRFHITKYPTLKVIRNGQPAKREYRGQRSVEAFTSFIKNQLEDPVKEFKQLRELGELESNKRIIIGSRTAVYFTREKVLLSQLVKEFPIVENKETEGATLTEKNGLENVYLKRKETTALRHNMLAASEGPAKIPKCEPMLKYVRSCCQLDVTVDCPWYSTHMFERGYFDRRDQPEYSIFRRVATNLKDDCQFHVGFEEASRQMHPAGQPIIVFRPDKDRSNDLDETYPGSLTNFDELHIWVSEKCVPLVREITFENAEELTEEGLPFLILFHTPDDKESIKRFNEIVQTDLISEKQAINFLTADGKKFAHPLHHLGKSDKDLPLIAIDSFRHMYLFPNYKDIEVPGKLKQFIQDLYSGKLHREFHYGPDSDSDTEKFPTTPPESTFRKLAPSKNRYTLLTRDEL